MIARFQVLLPFRVLVAADVRPEPEEVTIGDLKARIFPPHRSQLQVGDASGESGIAPSDVCRRLDPMSPQPLDKGVRIGEQYAVASDVLRIDFHRATFDRRSGANDPPISLAFELANSCVRRLRVLNRVPWARPLSETGNPWSLQFLNDDETEVERTEDKFRRLFGAHSQERIVAIDIPIWDAVKSLPVNYASEPSDELLLDAYGLLPQVGPALVLAYTAIETRIARALDRLASLVGLNPILWEWINDRGNYIKDPSTAEQLDVLAKSLIGKSLKDDTRLWEGYQNLRQARNGFVHSGKATLGKLQVEVDTARALELVQGAERIIDWIESLLPESERRPRFQSPNQVNVTRVLLTAPGDPGAEDTGADSTGTNDDIE